VTFRNTRRGVTFRNTRRGVNPRSALMFGAGNVGRGFLGQLFSESGYEVVFVDVDEPLLAALNASGSYPIHLVDNEHTEEVIVSPVRALHARQVPEVAAALAEASIAATAVGARALPFIAPLVAAGVELRARGGVEQPLTRPESGGLTRPESGGLTRPESGGLNIIICENLKGAASVFRQMVSEHVPAASQAYFQSHIGFVDTVIGRMVPPPTPEMRQKDPRLIAVESYKELPVERQGFIGPVPTIVGMVACDNFPAYTARKLYIHNCGHAMLAYLGYLRGHTFGYEALADPLIRPYFELALGESQAGIVAAYGVSADWLAQHRADLTRRFANRALGDTIFRLGRDPLRKLAANDRLVGSARLAEKAGITPQYLSWGIAAAYCFDPAEDSLAVALQERLDKDGLGPVMAEVSGLLLGEPLAALVEEHYRALRRGQWL
jgi:mannitol-1-phosphate 5-dehydrogenase